MKQNQGIILTKNQSGLLKYWVKKCQGDRLPIRRDITPAELVFCLPNISIVEQKENGDYSFRLTASALRDILGGECRGQKLSDVCEPSIPWTEAFEQAIKTRTPVFGETPCGHRRAHFWMRLPLEPKEDGTKPLLCYDHIEVGRKATEIRRERMFVTANAFQEKKRTTPISATPLRA